MTSFHLKNDRAGEFSETIRGLVAAHYEISISYMHVCFTNLSKNVLLHSVKILWVIWVN